jgi:hypothetical protein
VAGLNEQLTDSDADRAWTSDEPCRGLFGVPDRDLGAYGGVGVGVAGRGALGRSAGHLKVDLRS